MSGPESRDVAGRSLSSQQKAIWHQTSSVISDRERSYNSIGGFAARSGLYIFRVSLPSGLGAFREIPVTISGPLGSLNSYLCSALLILLCLLGVFPLDVILPSFPALAD